MEDFSELEIREGIRSLASTLAKCEKCLLKIKEPSSQHTLLSRRIKALKIAIALMEERLKQNLI